MTDRLRVASERLAARTRSRTSGTATYNDGTTSYTILPTLGRTLFRLSADYGATRIEYSDRDFLATPDELPIEPERGHTITLNGDTYLVAAPGDEPVWRWTDSFETRRRIHAKLRS